MGNFRSQGRGGGGSRYSDRSERSGGFGGRDRGDRGFSRDRPRSFEMHDATCDKCGKKCQVPFKPTGAKPVLCSDCFRQSEGSNTNFNSKSQGNFSNSGSGLSQDQFKQINTKLDKIIQTLQELEIIESDEDSDEEDEDSDEK